VGRQERLVDAWIKSSAIPTVVLPDRLPPTAPLRRLRIRRNRCCLLILERHARVGPPEIQRVAAPELVDLPHHRRVVRLLLGRHPRDPLEVELEVRDVGQVERVPCRRSCDDVNVGRCSSCRAAARESPSRWFNAPRSRARATRRARTPPRRLDVDRENSRRATLDDHAVLDQRRGGGGTPAPRAADRSGATRRALPPGATRPSTRRWRLFGRASPRVERLERAVTHHGAEREPLLDPFLREHVVAVENAVAHNDRVRRVERPRPQPRDQQPPRSNPSRAAARCRARTPGSRTPSCRSRPRPSLAALEAVACGHVAKWLCASAMPTSRAFSSNGPASVAQTTTRPPGSSSSRGAFNGRATRCRPRASPPRSARPCPSPSTRRSSVPHASQSFRSPGFTAPPSP
jgi:hypothetical protein